VSVDRSRPSRARRRASRPTAPTAWRQTRLTQLAMRMSTRPPDPIRAACHRQHEHGRPGIVPIASRGHVDRSGFGASSTATVRARAPSRRSGRSPAPHDLSPGDRPRVLVRTWGALAMSGSSAMRTSDTHRMILADLSGPSGRCTWSGRRGCRRGRGRSRWWVRNESGAALTAPDTTDCRCSRSAPCSQLRPQSPDRSSSRTPGRRR
jgi:hypothetical protein